MSSRAPRPESLRPFGRPRPVSRELEAAESWRSWLVSGSNAGAADPRRLRGAHRGLKKMLIEGVANGGPQPESWRHFSGAMVRLAINEALNSLPSDQNRVVWLAYFGGKTNREIAKQLGLSVGAVQRRLRVALEQVAHHIERGRKTAYGVILVLAGNRFGHPAPAPTPWGAAIRVLGIFTPGVAAATTIAIQEPPPPPQAQPARPQSATVNHRAPPAAAAAPLNQAQSGASPVQLPSSPVHSITV